jgi:hypothetical protein
MPFAKAQPSSDGECYNSQEVHAIANRERQCEKCEFDLTETMVAYKSCVNKAQDNAKWYQKPEVEIAGVTVVFTVGLVTGLTKCFGLCK